MPNSALLCFTRSTKSARARGNHYGLSNWVEQQGSPEVSDNVLGALDAIDKNEEFIKLTLAVLMAPER